MYVIITVFINEPFNSLSHLEISERIHHISYKTFLTFDSAKDGHPTQRFNAGQSLSPHIVFVRTGMFNWWWS